MDPNEAKYELILELETKLRMFSYSVMILYLFGLYMMLVCLFLYFRRVFMEEEAPDESLLLKKSRKIGGRIYNAIISKQDTKANRDFQGDGNDFGEDIF